MGRNNVVTYIYEASRSVIPPERRLAREIFVAMCLYAIDYPEGDPPVYYGGLERLAVAVGHQLHIGDGRDPEELRGTRQTILRKIKRQISYLRSLGLLVPARRRKPMGLNQHYAIVLKPSEDFTFLAGDWNAETGTYQWHQVPVVPEQEPESRVYRAT